MMVTHLPVLIRREAAGLVIAGHVSRANTHWTLMDGRTDSLVIFQGPHHYVSPSWYVDSPAVPTWNYAVVHARGKPMATQDRAFTGKILAELIERYEGDRPAPWGLDKVPAAYYDQLLSGIVWLSNEVIRDGSEVQTGPHGAGRVAFVRSMSSAEDLSSEGAILRCHRFSRA